MVEGVCPPRAAKAGKEQTMGLIAAAINSVTGELANQYKEYFYCESIPVDVLAVKGQKRKDKRSTNKGDDNIITTGSVIAVADGQCMLIVEQGKVVEVCAETGHYVYDASTEPSIFAGSLGSSIKEVFAQIGQRITFGGQKANDQRVYYINTKEITGNKYGTPSPVPFRVVDERAGIDMDISVKCFGEYSYKISNPILFYTNVCGNVTAEYKREQIDGQLKSEFLTHLQPAFARISEMGIRYSAVPGHTLELADAMNQALSAKWRDLRGIEVVSVGMSSIKADEEDEKTIKQMQKDAAYMDPRRGAAATIGANADALRAAASNSAGAGVGFMNLNMANQAGGVNAAALYQAAGPYQQPQVSQAAPGMAAPGTAAGGWTCPACGQMATGKFCTNCGAKKPEMDIGGGWTCPQCGQTATGNFCTNCGAKKPAGGIAACPNCGWKVPDPANPPKFCQECGQKLA